MAQISLSLEQLLQIKDPYIKQSILCAKKGTFWQIVKNYYTKEMWVASYTILYNVRSKTEIIIRKLLLRARWQESLLKPRTQKLSQASLLRNKKQESF